MRSGKPAPKKKSWRQDTSLKCIHCRRSKQKVQLSRKSRSHGLKCIFEDPSHFCRLCVKTKKPICGPKLTAPADKSRRADDENESSQWKKVKECIQRRRNRGESWDDVFHLLDPDSKQTAKQNSVPFSPNIPFSINAGLNVPDNMQFEEMPWEPYSHIPPISYPLGTQTDSNIPNSFDRAMIPISMTGTSHGIGLISEQEVEMLLNGVEIGEDMERFESWEGS